MLHLPRQLLEELHGQGPVHRVLLGQVEDRLSQRSESESGASALLRLVQLEEVFSSQRLWRIRFLSRQLLAPLLPRLQDFGPSGCRSAPAAGTASAPPRTTSRRVTQRSSGSPARSLRRIPSASSGAASRVEPTAAGPQAVGCDVWHMAHYYGIVWHNNIIYGLIVLASLAALSPCGLARLRQSLVLGTTAKPKGHELPC